MLREGNNLSRRVDFKFIHKNRFCHTRIFMHLWRNGNKIWFESKQLPYGRCLSLNLFTRGTITFQVYGSKELLHGLVYLWHFSGGELSRFRDIKAKSFYIDVVYLWIFTRGELSRFRDMEAKSFYMDVIYLSLFSGGELSYLRDTIALS